MYVVKAFGPGDLRLVERPMPTPGTGEVLIQVKASGICGSDKWYWSVSGETESVAGHEVSGLVTAIGPGVTDLAPGDRVAVNNVVGCGGCVPCAQGDFVRCPNWDGSRDVNHGLSEYILAPAVNCMKLQEGISYEMGCLIFDNWGTPFGGIERAGIQPGGWVLITGCGPIGLCATALAKGQGARVIAMDTLVYRLQAAKRMGADMVLEPGPGALENIREITGPSGTCVHLECSGSAAAYDLGLQALGVGGTFVCIGEHAAVQLYPSDHIIRKHLNVLGTWYTTMEQGRDVQALMQCGAIQNPTAFVTHRVSLADVPAIFGKVCGCSDNLLKAVILF